MKVYTFAIDASLIRDDHVTLPANGSERQNASCKGVDFGGMSWQKQARDPLRTFSQQPVVNTERKKDDAG